LAGQELAYAFAMTAKMLRSDPSHSLSTAFDVLGAEHDLRLDQAQQRQVLDAVYTSVPPLREWLPPQYGNERATAGSIIGWYVLVHRGAGRNPLLELLTEAFAAVDGHALAAAATIPC
jgi:hypothetical protein